MKQSDLWANTEARSQIEKVGHAVADRHKWATVAVVAAEAGGAKAECAADLSVTADLSCSCSKEQKASAGRSGIAAEKAEQAAGAVAEAADTADNDDFDASACVAAEAEPADVLDTAWAASEQTGLTVLAEKRAVHK